MMLVIQLNNDKLAILTDNKLTSLYTCIQELQLWLGEDPMDVEAGVDYFSIFLNQKFIELELQRVLDKHRNAYVNYSLENIQYEDDTLKVSIIFNVSSDQAFRFNLHIGNNR